MHSVLQIFCSKNFNVIVHLIMCSNLIIQFIRNSLDTIFLNCIGKLLKTRKLNTIYGFKTFSYESYVYLAMSLLNKHASYVHESQMKICYRQYYLCLTYLSAISTTPQSNDGSSAEHSWDI